MDVRLMSAAPTDEERAAVDALLGPPAVSEAREGERVEFLQGRVGRGGREVRELRTLLLPALHALQDRVGWISEGGMNYVCRRLSVPPAEAYGVATFYAMFSVEPRPRTVLHLCDDLACRVNGANELIADVAGELGPDRRSVVRSPCLGLCERAPAALVQLAGEHGERRRDRVGDPGRARTVLPRRRVGGRRCERGNRAPQTSSPADREGLRAASARRRGRPACARRLPRPRRLRGAVDGRSSSEPSRVIREITDAKLLGRGGAAFPTGVKWDGGRRPAGQRPHYLVCNADESEPGTFKDRVLMESDPFALIEAHDDRGLRDRRRAGFLYIRGEYPLRDRAGCATRSVPPAARGLLGRDVLGERFAFDIELRRGAGAYICGEETALFELDRGQARRAAQQAAVPGRQRPVRQADRINNVETLTTCLEILRIGAPAYAPVGAERSTGRKLFCVSGARGTPGGLRGATSASRCASCWTLAGGARRRTLRAVLLGGAAGGFVMPDQLDVPLTFEGTREAGATLGSGVVMAFDDTVDLTDMLPSHRRVLPRRVVRAVRAVPRRDRTAGGGAGPAGIRGALGPAAGARPARGPRPGDAATPRSAGSARPASSADRFGDGEARRFSAGGA